MVMQAVLMIGVSASGKTTLAHKEYKGFEVVERDVIRRNILREQGRIDDTMNLWSVWKFDKEMEAEVTRRYDMHLAICASAKANVVCSDTNLSEKNRSVLTKKLENLGYTVTHHVVNVDLMKAWERDEKRRDTVGRQVIYDQYQKFLAYTERKVYVPNKTKMPAILVDIDGTLAHMNGKRGPFDWDKVHLDDVDEAVRMMVNHYSVRGGEVIVLSGRDGSCCDATHKWLRDNDIHFARLIMRAPGDMRKDSIVKEEIFWRDIAKQYFVQFVIDDRPQVCRMWRELGLKVFQVADPHVEF